MEKSLRKVSRLLCLMVCIACALVLFQPVATAAQTSPAVSEFTYTSKVRNRASYGATVIGKLEEDTCLTILGQSGKFYKIDCYDMTGYIAMSQVELRNDGKYYVNCIVSSSETEILEYTPYAEAVALRESVYALARKQLGYPYVYGGTRPGGFDCSGLMLYLYRNHEYYLHRTASQQLQDGVIVARENLEVGDLIFFRVSGETYPASHVGIYVGDNRIIHAGSKGIVYADLDGSWFRDYYLCGRRIINTAETCIDELPVATADSAATYRRSNASLRTAGR